MFSLNATTQGTHTPTRTYQLEQADIVAFLSELKQSKQELDLARLHFDNVDDPLLIDHAIYRLGAAEQRFNYLFQMARRFDIHVGELHWDVMKQD